MKKIISTCIALMVSAACSISAFAMEVPTNTTIQDLNGVRQYIKIYTVAPDTDPQSLIDDVFEYDGYTYTYSSMTKEEQSYSEKEHHTETVTADTEKSDLSVVLKALSPSIEYDDGEFRGTLYLDHSTISTVASGYTTKSYTVSTTKEIDNLDTNDMAYVPDTTTKNGVTVQLQSVDWQVQGTSLVDDILVPAQYKAVATYAGRASYRAATGYVTTAKYIGDIVAEGIESVTYTVTYDRLRECREQCRELESKLSALNEMASAQTPDFDCEIREAQEAIGKIKRTMTNVISYVSKRAELTFSQLKMNRVEISLYDVVKSTGEVKDTFKFTYSGRRYDRLSLSEKIRAGMEVSELIKRLTGRNYPVFVDNMESVDDLANVRPTGQIIMAKCVSNAPLQVRPIKPIVFAEQRAA